jgi:hypothetical protein
MADSDGNAPSNAGDDANGHASDAVGNDASNGDNAAVELIGVQDSLHDTLSA